MKNIVLLFGLVALNFLFSCNEEPKPSCVPPIGEMIARVNDTLVWDFRHVYFVRWSEEYSGSHWADSSLNMRADFINAGCDIELALSFSNIAQTLNRQNLVKRIFGDNQPSRLQPNSIFRTYDIDALTERFELFESEPAWIQLSEITEAQVNGTFQGTYVYRPSALRFWDLPDTLRFNEVDFEAILFEPPVE